MAHVTRTCLCDPCVVTSVITVGITVQGSDSQQSGVLGGTKMQAPYTCRYMGAMPGAVLAYSSGGETAEHLSGSGPRPAVCISELIMRRPDTLHVRCELLPLLSWGKVKRGIQSQIWWCA